MGRDVKSREEFWDNWPVQPESLNNVFDSDFSKALRISDEELDQINSLVFEIIYYSLEDSIQCEVVSANDHEKIIQYLDSQVSFSINFESNANRFVALEKKAN